MSDQPDHSRTRDAAPWVVAAALAVLAAIVVLLLVHTNAVADHNNRQAGKNLLRPTDDQKRAVVAAATEAANLTTLSRATYETDFARALAGVTGTLKADLDKHKQAYLSAMNAGNFDLKASVAKSAFEAESGGKVTVLVTLNGSHVVANVTNPITTPQRLELTMERAKGSDTWLASSFVSVGVQ
ncbi:MAG: hypothetical protein ACRDVG_06045 [Jatrophihabitantaceae bacterium]